MQQVSKVKHSCLQNRKTYNTLSQRARQKNCQQTNLKKENSGFINVLSNEKSSNINGYLARTL